MSRTDLRALLAIAAAAFALRAGAAVLTEYKPIFPAYYYTDAEYIDRNARETVQAWSLGSSLNHSYSTSQRVHILLTALLYRIVGPRPLAAKLFNALTASLGLVAFGLLTGRIFSPAVGLVSAALVGCWPSHVFYTSQNFKEGLVCGVLMGAFLLLTPRADDSRRGGGASAAAGMTLLALLGFFRSHVMLVAASALAAAAAALLRRFCSRRSAALALTACLAAPQLYQLSLRALVGGALSSVGTGTNPDIVLIPKIIDPVGAVIHKPLSPAGITGYRRSVQSNDRRFARVQAGREIGTQLFPDERLESWLDVLLFIPKSSFYVLFMPLPGLYPMDGKPGRILATIENMGLLALFVLGLAAAGRGGLEPRRLGLLLFFAAMTCGSSLLEFDLGSAGRHKLMYMPMIFPFAVEESMRLMKRWRQA